MKFRARSPKEIAAFFILVVSLAVFGLQLRTLYTVPVFDSVRWGGDESWLMREYAEQIQQGVLIYPEYYGGARRLNGVLAGSMWGNSVLYGIPGIICFPNFDYVSIGRTVNAIFALVLLFSIYFLCRSLSVSPLLSSLSVAFMVLSQGFVWAVHSARYDLLTGLVLIWYCYYLSRIERLKNRRSFIAGAIGIFLIVFSPHLITLSAGASLGFFIHKKIWKFPSHFLSWLSGAIIAITILYLVYGACTGEFSLFGHGSSNGIFSFVIREIPILRPFSRNVQVSNVAERFHLFMSDIPGIALAIYIILIFLVLYKVSQWRMQRKGIRLRIARRSEQEFFLLATLLCGLSWLLLEGSRPYYLFHIVPVFVIAFSITLELWSDIFSHRWFGTIAAVAILVMAIALGAGHAIPSNKLGVAIATDQTSAISRFLPETKNLPNRKARILCDVAVLDRALRDTSRQVLTLDMFQPPPNATSLIQKLQSNKIDYVILRSSPVGTAFEPGRALIPSVLDSIGILQDSALGMFYDDGRNYDEGLTQLIDQGLDTLKLYRVNP